MRNTGRLESLDVLRGLDLFFLVAIEEVIYPLKEAVGSERFNACMKFFTHMEWEGFSTWDLVMPLFLFMSGVSIPFAMSRFRNGADRSGLIWRLLKRVLLLWIFGMMCQGNLLGLRPSEFCIYSNTLQTIAVGYLFAALFFLFTTWRSQLVIAATLLLAYWGAMELITVDGFGGGNYTPEGNFAEWVDRVVLGRFRAGASIQDGVVQFYPPYKYTWVLSSLNFIVTVMTGVFAGQLLKNGTLSAMRKTLTLAAVGVVMVGAGWLWSLELPVIKKIWTSSMVLVSSGYCFLLMALFYYVVDVLGWRRGTGWLKVYGMNSIMAYMLTQCISFRSVADTALGGLEQYIGFNWYQVLMAFSCVAIIYFILWRMYKQNIFLRV